MRAGPSLRTQEPAGKNSRPSSARHASRVPAGPAPSRPGSARKGKSSQRTTFSSPPKTFELAEQLRRRELDDENARRAGADSKLRTTVREMKQIEDALRAELAAAEAAVALAIALNFYNNHLTIDVDRAESLRG